MLRRTFEGCGLPETPPGSCLRIWDVEGPSGDPQGGFTASVKFHFFGQLVIYCVFIFPSIQHLMQIKKERTSLGVGGTCSDLGVTALFVNLRLAPSSSWQ